MAGNPHEHNIRAWITTRDESAARELVAGLYPLISAIVRRRMALPELREDLAQEVFMKLFAHLPRYDFRQPLEPWVSRIAVNACFDHLRARKRRQELRYADLSEREAAVLEATLPDDRPHDSEFATEARELFEKLLDTLAPKDRLVIRMLHLEQKSLVEIRELTGLSIAAIKVRAFRARLKLKQAFEKLENHRK